jgi:hypothetical protein
MILSTAAMESSTIMGLSIIALFGASDGLLHIVATSTAGGRKSLGMATVSGGDFLLSTKTASLLLLSSSLPSSSSLPKSMS